MTDFPVNALAFDPLYPTRLYAGTYGGGVFSILQAETLHRIYLPLLIQ